MNYRIFPPQELLEASIELPLSKSMSNRALIISAFAPNVARPERLADCTDTRALEAALASDAPEVNVGGAGTAMRFLTAYFASQPGRVVTLDGDARMRQRPIGVLVDALRDCGAAIEYAGEEGFPPLRITGTRLHGGNVTVDAGISSQYISALLMAAPIMTRGLVLELDGDVSSLPYIDLTIDMMKHAGAVVERDRETVTVAPQGYSGGNPMVEADWSAASYWYEIEALTSGFLTLNGLSGTSKQGDRCVADIYADLGVTTDFNGEDGGVELMGSPDLSPRLILDMSHCPDIAQTVAVTCAMIGVPFKLTGLASLRIKETDRISALANELRKVGVVTVTSDSTIEWDGRRMPVLSLPEFDTYGDHRMALAFAPVAVYIPGVVIRDAEVVDKSYPEYWAHLESAGFVITDGDAPLEDNDVTEE